MKKLWLCLCLVLLVPFVFTGCKKREQELNLYIIDAQLNTKEMTLSCKQSITYVNSSDNALNSVKFHLYANAFRQGAKAKPVSSLNFNDAYPNGFSEGKITINSVSVKQQSKQVQLVGEDDNILEVSLNEELFPEEKVEIEMEYVIKLPNVLHRFGYGEKAINLGNFYPIACVYESGKGFVTDLYTSNGDPFYSDVANYQVKITYPQEYIMASSGDASLKTSEQTKTSLVKADKVRDFAMVFSKYFKVAQKEVDDIDVKYYYYDDEEFSKSLEIACKAMTTFNKLFGAYPYSQVSVVQTQFIHGGMEYPNLVMISDENVSHQDYEYVIVHELAHQWWYGVVGNNEYINSWLDEGLTEYSTLLFYENNKEYNLNIKDMISNANKNYKHFVEIYTKINKTLDTSMDRRLTDYATEPEYVHCTYTKGMLLFDSFRESVGDGKFFKALKNYYKKYAYKNVSAEEFIQAMCDCCGYNIERFFTSWIDGSVVIM